jgi:Tol biopolymer transport system component
MWRSIWKLAAIALGCALAATAAQYENPAWSPDGKSIVFVMKTAASDWNIYRAGVDGSNVRQLTRNGAWDPAWSPDGKSIAFVSMMEGRRQISVMSAEGLNVRLLTSGPAEHFHPAFSPDGNRIALTSVENRASRIVVMDSGGSNSKPVTPVEQRSRWPTWSPDGKRIAYFVQGPLSEIWQVNVETLERAKLCDFGLGATTLDWSAVRNEIALTRGTGKETGIDILNLETHQIRRVLFADQASQPRWSPDGTQILFPIVTGLAVLDLSSSTVHALLH